MAIPTVNVDFAGFCGNLSGSEMKKVFVLVILISLVTGGLWVARSKKNLPLAGDPVIAEKYVAKAERRDINYVIEVTGDVIPDYQLDVRPEVGGKLRALHVEPGQRVKKGEALCEIDDTDLMNQRRAAVTEMDGSKLDVEKNRKNFERSKSLFASKLVSSEVFDNLSSDYELSKNRLSKAQRQVETIDDNLRKTKIVAPMDGTVLNVNVIEGQVVVAAASVNSGTSLMTIADLSKLLVDTNVNQIDVARLKANQKVKLTSESLKDTNMEAIVNFIAPIATVKNGIKGFQVQALIEHPDLRLRPGMTVSMSIPVASAQEAVSVPISAVFKDENNAKIVYVKHGDSTEKREVKVGVTNLDFAEIKSGIQPGEEILLVEPRLLEKKS